MGVCYFCFRRWRGTRIDAEEATRIPSDEPVFALVTVPASAAGRNVASGTPAGRKVTGAPLWDRISGLSSNRLDRASPALAPVSRGFQPARMSAQAKAGGSLKNRNGGEELVAFSSVRVGDSVVRSFITPARLVSSTHASLMAEARLDASSIHWFRLSPLARLR